ncbi:hypothetical protein [Streptomyces varsoviensis]|uniref:Lipoprotein n=1 Tax=Streptomyces varsoviensis TaxID=67373 RepID=A0ABR5JF53_9ACTN|nr:hypothetical protein [Streptomyces varsoviensis]KOG91989.1 hypothetical protein ADK38_00145 [Streptomyces varsoviensis]
MTGGTVASMAAAACLVLSGCNASGEGVRKEGPARSESAAKAKRTPSASASPSQEKVDAVALIKDDPKVSPQVKWNLKPCAKNQYPVDVSYAQLTDSARTDIVVNVLTCGDSFGVGAYVYQPKEDTASAGSGKDSGSETASASASPLDSYENVFSAEQSPVYADVDRRDLRVTRQIYASGDAMCCPSGEDVITYHWKKDKFQETGRTHTDYSKAVNGDDKDDLPSAGTEG